MTLFSLKAREYVAEKNNSSKKTERRQSTMEERMDTKYSRAVYTTRSGSRVLFTPSVDDERGCEYYVCTYTQTPVFYRGKNRKDSLALLTGFVALCHVKE